MRKKPVLPIRLLLACLLLLNAPLYSALYEKPQQSNEVSCPGLYYAISEKELTPTHIRELPDNAQDATRLLHSTVDRLKDSAGKLPAKYFNDEGNCIACSATMQRELIKDGFTVKRWEVSHGRPLTVRGKETHNFTYHYFLTLHGSKEREEIVIDPTYLQFLKADKRKNHPPVFIGTRAELVDFFKKNQTAIQRQGFPDRESEEIDPSEFVDLTYGYGIASTDRKQ